MRAHRLYVESGEPEVNVVVVASNEGGSTVQDNV